MRFLVTVRNERGELERDYTHGPGPMAPVRDELGRQIVYVEQATPCSCEASDVRFDYARQAWVENGRFIRCGHPEAMNCGCYGRAHAGEVA